MTCKHGLQKCMEIDRKLTETAKNMKQNMQRHFADLM